MIVKGENPSLLLPAGGSPELSALLQAFQLKKLFRQGWLKRGVPEAACESVADHTFGVALLALLAPAPAGPAPDRFRAAAMAVVHELGEVWTGDITPVDGVSKEEKARREAESLDRVLAGLPLAAEIRELWDDFEAGESPEARFVRQLDRLEMGVQAAAYRAEGHPRMEEFLDSADRAVGDPALRAVLAAAATAASAAAAASGSPAGGRA